MDSRLFVRIVALIPLLAGALLWSNHHLGIGPGNLGWLSVPLAIIAAVVAWIEKLLDDSERQTILRTLRDSMRAALSVETLIVLYLFAAALGLVYSSIIVYPDPNGTSASVSIAPMGEPGRKRTESEPRDGLRRFHVATTPFGRSFRIEMDGYVPETLDVYPIVGLKVRPGKELRRSPSLLVRLSRAAIFSLQNGGAFVVKRVEVGTVLLAADREPRSAFLVGRAQPLPPASYTNWRMELLATEGSEQAIAKAIVGWSRPKVLRPWAALEPGMMVLAEVRSRVGKRVAWTEISLNDESLIDVSLEESDEAEGLP